MIVKTKLVALAIGGFAIFAVPAGAVIAQTATLTDHRFFVRKRSDCPLRRVAGGDLADCRGWRFVNGHWDSSCFNLDYLPSQFACSGWGRR